MCIVIICFPVFDVINFEIKFTFLSSRFPIWPKNSGQNSKYLKNEKSFIRWKKSIFHCFNCQKLSKPWEWTFKVIADRRSRPEVFCKKGVLKYFSKLTGKHRCQSFFFNPLTTNSQWIKIWCIICKICKIWCIIKYFPKIFPKFFPPAKNLAGTQVSHW